LKQINLKESRFFKYLFFGVIYFSIGIEFSVMLIMLPIYLIEKGISLPLATLVIGIGTLPWMIKFIWGGIVDYYIDYGRKIFVYIGGILGGIGFLIISFIDPIIALIPFTFFIFLTHIGTAFVDVSTDAWAIDISSKEDRGKINGIMMYGSYIGKSIGLAGFGFLALSFNYSYVFIITGLILIIAVFFPIIINEIKIEKKHGLILPTLIKEFKNKTTQLISVFAPLSNISLGMMMIVVPLFLKFELDLDIGMIGLITMIFSITIAFGSIIGGVMTDRWGRKKCLYGFIFPSIIFTALFVFAYDWKIAIILYGLIGFLLGGYSTIITAIFMDVTNPRVGATQFSILASLSNFGELGVGAISGTLIVMLGFSRTFLYAAWILGPVLIFIYFFKEKKNIGLRQN